MRLVSCRLLHPAKVSQAGFEPAAPCSQNKCSARLSYCKIRYLPTTVSATVVSATVVMRPIDVVVRWTAWVRPIGRAWCRVHRVCRGTVGHVDDIPLTTTRIVTNHVSSTSCRTDAEGDYDCENEIFHLFLLVNGSPSSRTKHCPLIRRT